jgi:dTDP-3-amino-3,4,6-trideoxy-alpha-D-glucose transaminase
MRPELSFGIPSAAPSLRLVRFGAEIRAAVERVLASGRLILGPEVESFEQSLAAYLGLPHCVGVASGTDALALALRALGVGSGDEVVSVAMTAPATAAAILSTGATLRFVDIDPRSRGMDPVALASAITHRTAAIVPVHLHGSPAPMVEIMAIAERHALAVVEDCAQACGAHIGGRKLGSFGQAAAVSFYPTKIVGALGAGGADVTHDAAIAERVRRFRFYGMNANEEAVSWGTNSRLDEIQAAILSVLLPHLDAHNEERRQVASAYRTGLAGSELGLPPDPAGAIYHHFAVVAPDRERLATRLAAKGIGTRRHYSPGLHRHEAFADRSVNLPQTDLLAARTLSLPIQPEAVLGSSHRVVEAVVACLG